MAGGAPRALLRRVLWIAGTALGFVLLAVLGLGLASLLPFGDAVRPEPEPVPVARPTSPPVAELPAPPPPPAPRQAVAVAPAPPPPAPAAAPTAPLLPDAPVPTKGRLRTRQEVLRQIATLKDELARCPGEAVSRTPPTARAALVLETVVEGGALRVVSSALDADGPVNERFVTCARALLEAQRFPVTRSTEGTRLRISLPLGPQGNALTLSTASLRVDGR